MLPSSQSVSARGQHTRSVQTRCSCPVSPLSLSCGFQVSTCGLRESGCRATASPSAPLGATSRVRPSHLRSATLPPPLFECGRVALIVSLRAGLHLCSNRVHGQRCSGLDELCECERLYRYRATSWSAGAALRFFPPPRGSLRHVLLSLPRCLCSIRHSCCLCDAE
jgi:hypothetical protein